MWNFVSFYVNFSKLLLGMHSLLGSWGDASPLVKSGGRHPTASSSDHQSCFCSRTPAGSYSGTYAGRLLCMHYTVPTVYSRTTWRCVLGLHPVCVDEYYTTASLRNRCVVNLRRNDRNMVIQGRCTATLCQQDWLLMLLTVSWSRHTLMLTDSGTLLQLHRIAIRLLLASWLAENSSAKRHSMHSSL